MTPLVVEWRRLAVEGETCERCGSTGANVRAAVTAMRPVLAAKGLALDLREVELPPEEIAHSNEVLIDGVPIEELVGGQRAASDCPSCGDLVGEPCTCRTVRIGDEEYEELPELLIAAAIMTAADRRIRGDHRRPPGLDGGIGGGCGCGCGSSGDSSCCR